MVALTPSTSGSESRSVAHAIGGGRAAIVAGVRTPMAKAGTAFRNVLSELMVRPRHA